MKVVVTVITNGSLFKLIYYSPYIASSVLNTDKEPRLMLMEGGKTIRKVPNCVPHDLGDPSEFIKKFYSNICSHKPLS